MSLGRREFIAGVGAFAALGRSTRSLFAEQGMRPAGVFPASVRADFPVVAHETYLTSAALHPLGTLAAPGVERGIEARMHGPGDGREDFGAAKQEDLKKRYGQLINAVPSEIAFTANTSD